MLDVGKQTICTSMEMCYCVIVFPRSPPRHPHSGSHHSGRVAEGFFWGMVRRQGKHSANMDRMSMHLCIRIVPLFSTPPSHHRVGIQLAAQSAAQKATQSNIGARVKTVDQGVVDGFSVTNRPRPVLYDLYNILIYYNVI